MTNPYTPEKVAELVAKAKALTGGKPMYMDEFQMVRDLWTALTAVSAERDSFKRQAEHFAMRGNIAEADRDRLHKAITEALATAPKLGELRWRNVDRMIGILRAALDKEGNDDE